MRSFRPITTAATEPAPLAPVPPPRPAVAPEASRSNSAELREAALEEALAEIDSRDPLRRAAAARRLGDLRAEPTTLVGLCYDRNGHVRAAAAAALAGLPDEHLTDEVADCLISLLDDEIDEVRAETLRSVGRLGLVEAEAEVRQALDDSSGKVAGAAALCLARLQVEGAGEVLARMLEHPNHRVRQSVVRGLGLLRYRPAGVLILQELENSLRTRSSNLAMAGACVEAVGLTACVEAIPLLLNIAQENVGLRSTAVIALSRIDPVRAAQELGEMLTDPSVPLQTAILDLMAQADHRAALPAVRQLLRTAAPQVRARAASLLAEWGDALSIPTLRSMCRVDPNPQARPAALRALVKLAGQEALPEVLDGLRDTNQLMRAEAGARLAGLGLTRQEAESLERDQTAAAESEASAHLSVDLRAGAAEALQFLVAWRAEVGERAHGSELATALATVIEALEMEAQPGG